MRPSASVTTSAPRNTGVSWLNVPRLRVPLPTLNVPPRDGPPTARGESGSYSFLPIGLSPNIPCQLAWRTHSSTIDSRFQRPPPKIPDFGFSHGPASSCRHRSVRCGAFRRADGIKADPAIPLPRATFTPPFDDIAHRNADPPQDAGHQLQHRHLHPEVLARNALCCPVRPRLATSSASQEDSDPLPGIAGYRTGP